MSTPVIRAILVAILSRFPRPSPVLRPYPGVAAGLAPSLTIWLDRREQNYRATGISSEKDAWAGQRRVRGIRMTDAYPYCLGTGPRTRSANAVAFAVREPRPSCGPRRGRGRARAHGFCRR